MSSSKTISFDLICSPKIKNPVFQISRHQYNGGSICDNISVYCSNLLKRGLLKYDTNGQLIPENEPIEEGVTYFTPILIGVNNSNDEAEKKAGIKKLIHTYYPAKMMDVDVYHVASKMHNKLVFVMLMNFRYEYSRASKNNGLLSSQHLVEQEVMVHKKAMEMALVTPRKKLTVSPVDIVLNTPSI